MVQYQVKLQLNKSQEATLEDWLWHLEAVWNWGVRKFELDAKDKVYYNPMSFRGLLVGHSKKLGIPSHVIRGTLDTVYDAWQRCFKKLSKTPRLKGRRNKLNSIPFPDPIKRPMGNHIRLLGIGVVRFHKQWLPEGVIKCGRVVKRASGWHLCLFIDAEPKPIPHVAQGEIGVDPGFETLLALSTGEKIKHPRELERHAKRLAQAHRGNNFKLAAKIEEHIGHIRRERNHKISRRLVSENRLIVFSKDTMGNIAKTFGKSVLSSGHFQLREMIAYKCRTSGRQYIEVDSRYSTMTC